MGIGPLHIRGAGQMDSGAMADLLNQIIDIGGTTALTDPIDKAELWVWMQTPQSIWHVAEDQKGVLKGFQWIEPKSGLPADTLDISTFVRAGETGLGTGSALFEQTKTAARQAGAKFIIAVIRADNAGGLAYYQSRGFDYHSRISNTKLGSGMVVDRIQMRFEL